MQSHIQKWGNSLGIRIPAKVAKELHLHSGSTVTLKVESGQLIIQAPQYNLETMLQAMTPENQHHSLLDDAPVGNEEW